MQISGVVIYGDGIGRTLGFPTANLAVSSTCGVSSGVYACSVNLDGTLYSGALAVQDSPWKFEVHILQMDNHNLYGKTITVEVLEKISEMQPFSSMSELQQKIAEDVQRIQSYFDKKN